MPRAPAGRQGAPPLSHFHTVVDDFFPGAAKLRSHFEARVGSPQADPIPKERFVWDFWHVPGIFTYVRTHADTFFPPALYEPLIQRLAAWSVENLGLAGLTAPWLSYYVEGCRQEVHRDTANGVISYVLSLTPWEQRKFRGGETFIGASEPSLILVPAHFNRLTAFDARLPHGVRKVEGTLNPLEARLVIHGWFQDAGVVVSGALTFEAAAPVLEAAMPALQASLDTVPAADGVLSFRLEVGASGGVERAVLLLNTLVSTGGRGGSVGELAGRMARQLEALRFPAAEGPSRVTIPFTVST
jgi:hypothetical protein